MAELIFEQISERECADDAGFWRIYETSFPPEELEPKHTILGSCALGGMLFRARRGQETVAMAVTQFLPETQTLFLVYMAVDESMRGQSVGSQLLEFFFAGAAQAHPGMKGMVWEVDRICDAHDAADREKREKRVRFYLRHGGSVVPFPYRQPALDGIHTVAMDIFFRPLGGSAAEGYDLAREIYFGKYGKVTGVSQEHLEDLLAGKSELRAPF